MFQWARKTKNTSAKLLDTAVRRGVAGGYMDDGGTVTVALEGEGGQRSGAMESGTGGARVRV